MNIYPRCIHSLNEFYKLNPKLLNNLITKNLNINLFDVTLRDGLQGISTVEQHKFTTDYKKQIYNNLIQKHNPINLEIGSCINKKILPIFNDTEELFKYTECNKNKNKIDKKINHYILVPNEEQLLNALKFGSNSFSFITSVSNSFQLKNTKMTKHENLINLNNMMAILDDYPNFKIDNETNECIKIDTNFKIKLYVSCINECPIEGKIDIPNIIADLYVFDNMKFDKICLSDTCGTITHSDFVEIIENIKKIGINIEKISLHLHVKPNREKEMEEIFHSALDYGIREFDVSELKTGGCSVTMDKNNLAPNMSYEQYYKFLINYLIK